MELKGKTAVITGASSGIGRAIACRLAADGANVIVCANRSGTEAELVAQEITSLGVRSTVLSVDLAQRDRIPKFVQEAWAWNGGVDIWVNSAGADVLTGQAADMDFFEKLQQLWQVDVVGSIACAREVGAFMKQARHGTIINIGWDQAWQGMEGDSGEMFAAVKGAVMAFTKSLAKSLAPEVRVNCVAPGWIKTQWGEEASGYWQARAVHESLRSRWGTPQDVAEAVHFLTTSAADFINAQILPVNGGFRSSASRRP